MARDKHGNRIRRNRLMERPKWQQHLTVAFWCVFPLILTLLSIWVSILANIGDRIVY